MTAPEITVGMPCFNSARTLARAVASVRAQTEVNWRLILSDDRSDDESWEICQAAAQSDPRIEARRQPARRHFLNFGDLLAGVETPYFAWLAADDYWAPDFLRLTRDRLAQTPAAVSALPGCIFVGPKAPEHPPMPSLDGPPSDRIRRYLAHPGGTRMYGLFRTPVLRKSFPKRNMNAYDWYLMVGVLNAGAQVEVPMPLLFREYTDWMRYSEMVPALYRTRILRRFPALDMSLQLLRDGRIPPANLPDLYRMNLRKHEEYLAVMHPDDYRRRAPLFRRLKAPISNNPGRIAAIAERLIREAPDRREGAVRVMLSEVERGSGPAMRVLDRARAAGLLGNVSGAPKRVAGRELQSPAAVGHALPPVTAILTCRNAEGMVRRQLEHLDRAGARVIVVDHGSCDHTRAVAEAHIGKPVAEIIDEPFDGVFDLTRQIRLKRQIIGELSGGWVLHVDADEFLDAPQGSDLRSFVGAWDSTEWIAAGCNERLFLPTSDSEFHSPDDFERTMTRFVVMAERDAKQRLFRADAPLDLWMRTGGHTICRDDNRIVPERLVLRHYLGLSLDDIRAKYFARVFARGDVGKFWHGNRMAALKFDVVPPDPDALCDGNECGADQAPVRNLPIFAPLSISDPGAIPPDATDLLVLAAPSTGSQDVVKLVIDRFPDLRLHVTDDPFAALSWRMPVPLLNLVEHPAAATESDARDEELRRRASDWVRRLAVSRQIAQAPGRRYREVRIEDAAKAPARFAQAVTGLLLRTAERSSFCLVTSEEPEIGNANWPSVVRRIAGPLACDLSYR